MPRRTINRTQASLGAFVALLLFLPAGPVWAAHDPRESIVKVFASKQDPDYDRPWSRGAMYSVTGSGWLIEGHRVLTNAHVISNHTFIEVRRYGDTKKYKASVDFVSHEADLALLRVDDASFFEGTSPLELGPLANVQDEVTVLGFPAGGDTLSTTTGVVSRVEHQTYVHSTLPFLAAQIDAAINSGNSGGPAILAGRVAGVAMQSAGALENVGYIIPSAVIQHFLDDVADGRYDGFPRLGVFHQNLENPDMRRSHGMRDHMTGVRVSGVVPGTPASGVLEAGDVILSVAGHSIAQDGTVEFRNGERTSFAYYTDSLQIGDSVRVRFLRDGRQSSATLLLDTPKDQKRLVPLNRYDRQPSYYVFGGLAFTPLTRDYLLTWEDLGAPAELTVLHGQLPSVEGEEVVVLATVLAADVNRGYHGFAYGRITSVDGVKLLNLSDLIQRVEAGRSEFVTFGYGEGLEIVLDRAKARAATRDICEQYKVPADRSDDLADGQEEPRARLATTQGVE